MKSRRVKVSGVELRKKIKISRFVVGSVPLQTRGVLLEAQEQVWQHSRQGCSTEDHPER